MRLNLGPPSSPFDLAIVVLVSFHLLFSLAAAAFVVHFHLRSSSSPSSSSSSPTSPSLRRRLGLVLRLNSIWPVRLLLVLFACLLSLSELLALPRGRPLLCRARAVSSQAFAEPAFFTVLLFLLRASTGTSSCKSSSSAFLVALLAAVSASVPFVAVQVLYFSFGSSVIKDLNLPPRYFWPPLDRPHDDRCRQPLFPTMALACFGVVYVPLFISACLEAVKVVINRKLRVRLYVLAAALVVALPVQVSSLAFSSLWPPSCALSKGLALAGFVAVLVCVAIGEGILVVQPIVDALAVVVPEQEMGDSPRRDGNEEV